MIVKIQHRRGAYADYDPTKVLPGELVVVQSDDPATDDGKAIYIGTASGTIKRLATAEEIGAYNAQGAAILAQVQQTATNVQNYAQTAQTKASEANTSAQSAAQSKSAIDTIMQTAETTINEYADDAKDDAIDGINQAYEERVDEINDKIDQLVAITTDAEEIATSAKNKVDGLETDLDETTAKVDSNTSKVNGLQTEVDSMIHGWYVDVQKRIVFTDSDDNPIGNPIKGSDLVKPATTQTLGEVIVGEGLNVKADGTLSTDDFYMKPASGIPKSDLASDVQTSLGKADTALQEHQDISGKANIADVQAALSTKADVSDVEAIEETLSTKADTSDVEAIETELATKADTTDVEALETELSGVETTLAGKAEADDVDQLKNALSGVKEDLSDIVGDITVDKTVSGTLVRIAEKSVSPISVSGAGVSETVYVTSTNLLDISQIPDREGLVVNHGTYLTITQNAQGDRVNCLKKLSELCPTLKDGDKVYIKADTTGTNKQVYFNGPSQNVSFGTQFTVTSSLLNSYLYFYASGASTSADITNLMVCFDVNDTYEPYNNQTYSQDSTKLENDINYVFGSADSALTVTYDVMRFDNIEQEIEYIVDLVTKQVTSVGNLISINDAIGGDVVSVSGATVGEKIYVGSRNLFDISVIPDTTGKVVNNGDSLTITQSTSGGVNVLKTLKDICKGLREGDVVTINATTSGLKKIYLASGDSWVFGTRKTITSAMLADNCWVYFYANGEGTTKTISDIQVWFGKAVGDYESYRTKEYTSGTDTIKLENGDNLIWSANDSTLTITYNASTITEASDGVMNYSRWKGKNVLVLGDSISADNYLTYPSWASLMSNYFGMNLVNPSVHAVGYVCGVDTPTPNSDSLINLLETLHTQYPNNDDFDLIIFFRGTNDFGNSIPIGSSGDAKTASFTGAVEWCFKYANDNWSKARIVVFTPMQRITGQVANSASAKLEDYADVIRDKAKAIGFDVLDLFNKSGFSVLYNPFGAYASGYNDFAQQYCLETPEHNPDGLHPNKLFTDTRLFPQISEFIKGV